MQLSITYLFIYLIIIMSRRYWIKPNIRSGARDLKSLNTLEDTLIGIYLFVQVAHKLKR